MSAPRTFERTLRSIAFDVLAARDGQRGWKRGRRGFRADAALDADGLKRAADARLTDMLRHAFETSEYYAESFRTAGFTSSRDLDASSLARLPFVTKTVIREQREKLRSDRYTDSQLHKSMTGGTTGVQTPFYLDHDCVLNRVGRQWGVLESQGYGPGMRRGLVWGVHSDVSGLDADASLKRRFRRFASGDEVMCCTVMSDALMRDFHARLLEFRPQVLYGYPTALERYASFVGESGLAPIRVERIFTTAERLHARTRALLQTTFGGPVHDLYCTREYGCIAFECAAHRGMHIDSGSIRLEICDANGDPVPAGESGEFVITDLFNRGMPLIRSRMGDYGRWSTEVCGCGLPFPLISQLEGRSTDTIHLPDGSTVAGLMLADLFTDLPAVRFAQFVQDVRERLRILLILDRPLTPELARAAMEETRTIVGSQIHLDIEQVADLPRNPRSGKIPEVVSNYRPQGPAGT
jgi:phenylacetate-CoA ligase